MRFLAMIAAGTALGCGDGLPSYRTHRELLATVGARAAACRPLSAACACPPADSLPATLSLCDVRGGRVVLSATEKLSREELPRCASRVFAYDPGWVPDFPRDERALDGVTWVSGARRRPGGWVQVELNPCLD